ncbi:MAG: type II toxin-antitoxin system HipA family toxin [Candidatus Competibacterales bacterium]
MTDARVILWGRDIGAVSWLEDREIGVFQYTPDFVQSGIEVAPLMMPLREFPYEFPNLPRNTFKGLPGMLADALPDKFGNAIIDAWLAANGKTAASFNPVERLCYIGKRGMGALEFEPALFSSPNRGKSVQLAALVDLANRILDERSQLGGALVGEDDQDAIEHILRVGTSAGGARAKAILAWNPQTGEFRSGQLNLEAGFEHWLIKFDGISGNGDRELADPRGYGLVEYAYHLMAVAAGIDMFPCRLHHEGGRSHFMTKRFDRTPSGGKRHMQSLGALGHYDYNQPTSYSYEQALQVIRRLDSTTEAAEQQLLRAIFNVVSRNQDDHVKNIAFLMNRRGEWRLSPAYDISYAWNPGGAWTGQHQMSLNGKRDNFDRDDFIALAQSGNIKARRAQELIDRVIQAVTQWPHFAAQVGIVEERATQIARAHRTTL